MKLWVYALVVILGFLLLFFSNPNRLAHDQIYHRTFYITYQEKDPFKNDYLFGDPRNKSLDNYYSYKIIGYLGQKTGAIEYVYWLLLPVVFVIFTIGMFELIYFVTANILISLFVSIISNYHFYIFAAEWGLPGPSELDPWAIFWAIIPILLTIYITAKQKNKKYIFFATLAALGLLSNIHLITGFYIISALLITNLWMGRFSSRAFLDSVIGGALAIVTAMPFLVRNLAHRVTHLTQFDPLNSDHLLAINMTAYHVTLPGRVQNLRIWLFDMGYIIWPLLAAALIVLLVARKRMLPHAMADFTRFGVVFICSVLGINLAVSLVQIFRYLVLHQLPFWNEPRGVQLIYYVLFPFLGLALTLGWERIRPWFTFPRQVLSIGVMVVVTSILAARFHPTLQSAYLRHITPRFSSDTCDSNLYRALNALPLPAGVILQDPDFWSAFRICTLRPVVVQSRDRASAYSLGTDVLMEWYSRYRTVTGAFSLGGDRLLAVADQYGARTIVSRFCVPVDETKLLRREEVRGEGCIYITKPAD